MISHARRRFCLPAGVLVTGLVLTSCGSSSAGKTAQPSAAVEVITAAPEPSVTPAPEAVTLAAARKTVKPEIAPLDGETVGVGQPVSLVFKGQKVEPALRAGVEGRLKVTTSPTKVSGAWHWAEAKGDTYLHFRPEKFWPANTKVTVDAKLAKVKLADGTAAGQDRTVSFTVGDSMVTTVDLAAHKATVVRNGETLRTIPVSGGEPKFKTRDGVKVILSKDGTVLMDSRTIGIPRNHADGFYGKYNWSMRETISGEYVHAAPDNAESFGKENVSHGCVGMSEADAKWLYGLSRKGDVVNAAGESGKPMDEFGNGYGDWNISWDRWLAGSATGVQNT